MQAVHYGPAPVERRLTLTSEGQVVAARTLTLPPGEPQAAIFDDLPANLPYVEARLEGSDALAADDRAWAAPPAPSTFRIDLVTEGNRFLQAALSLLPGAGVTAVRPADYTVAECQPGRPCPRAELTVFDAAPLPEELPPGALLVIAPPQATRLFSVTGGLDAPFLAPARADESLLRYVDLRQVQLRSAAAVPLPTWARPVVVAPGTSCPLDGVDAPCPLLFAGQAEGRRIAVMAFDLRQSDLPLRPAFPVLLANLLDYFRGPAAGGVPATLRPGEAVTLVLPPGAENPAVTLPGGQRVPVREGADAVPFDRTELPGLYTLEYEGAAGRVRQQFAVNLFDPRESDLAPVNSLPLIGLRRGAAGETPSGRQEWWRPLAALALAVLLLEWLVAHRSDLLRLRHALVVRSAPGRR